VVAHFDETVASLMPAPKLKETWEGIEGQFGSLQRIAEYGTAPYQQYLIVIAVCEFADQTAGLKFVFDKENKVAGFFIEPGKPNAPWEPPTYADESKFTEEGVTVGQGEWKLPGTLTIPAGEGPFPAVALVHGSGPNDRDESIGPQKVFKDIAWGLASQGIAVLRYEKRTKAYSSQLAGEAGRTLTVKEETIEDVVAAVALLKSRPELDPQQVFVLGHSLGALLMPRIAAVTPEVKAYIALTAPNRPLEEAIVEQTEYLLGLDGIIDEAEQAGINELKALAAKVKSPDLSPDDPENLGGAYAPYWLALRGYVPAEAARTITKPLLVLQGGRDYQVTVPEFEAWQASLKGHENVTFRLYPSLNHLFMTGEDAPNPNEYKIPGHVAIEVINDLAIWLKSGALPTEESDG
jgi:dienelactone hydrolase